MDFGADYDTDNAGLETPFRSFRWLQRDYLRVRSGETIILFEYVVGLVIDVGRLF